MCACNVGDMVKVCAKYGRSVLKAVWFWAVSKTLTWSCQQMLTKPSCQDSVFLLWKYGTPYYPYCFPCFNTESTENNTRNILIRVVRVVTRKKHGIQKQILVIRKSGVKF
jgi:hypothetical protein